MLTSVQELVPLPFGVLAYVRTLMFHINQCVCVYTFERLILLLRQSLVSLILHICSSPQAVQYGKHSQRKQYTMDNLGRKTQIVLIQRLVLL